MKDISNPDKMASPGKALNRRSLLGWMVGIAAGAFAVSFAVPAAGRAHRPSHYFAGSAILLANQASSDGRCREVNDAQRQSPTT